MMSKSSKFWFLVLILALLVVVVVSIGVGSIVIAPSSFGAVILKSVGINPGFSVDPVEEAVFWTLRLPRTGFSVLVGAALALSGTALQGIFRNPLVDAAIVGISSGSSLFAASFIVLSGFLPVLFPESLTISLAFVAFSGALVTALLVYRVSWSNGKVNTVLLILSGIALNALTGAMTGLLTYFADDKQLRDLTFWSLGSLSGASALSFWILVPFVVIPAWFIFRQGKALNAFALGENAAYYLGINTHRVKTTVLIAATAMVGASVAFVGVIGFVGLVVPHILRMLVGPDYRVLLPLSAVSGAILLTIADILSRTLLPPTEIPIGIITAIVGTPVLIGIIFKQKKRSFA